MNLIVEEAKQIKLGLTPGVFHLYEPEEMESYKNKHSGVVVELPGPGGGGSVYIS